MEPSRLDCLNRFTLEQLAGRIRDRLVVPATIRARKFLLVNYVMMHADEEFQRELELLGREMLIGKSARQKRKWLDSHNFQRSVRHRLVANEVDEDEQEFLLSPSFSVVHDCSHKFYAKTGHAALESTVCAVCGRECGVMDEDTSLVPFERLPNSDRLRPLQPHPAQHLFNGCLLELAGVLHTDEGDLMRCCSGCLQQLRDNKQHGPPRLSLANGLWIGEVPWQLECLSFAEQLLVALLYPRVYVFKLFPKKIRGVRTTDNLQRGMRGNVSTYELSPDGIASMVAGRLMPCPPEILASLITVMFVGVGQLPQTWMGKTFRVRRRAVAQALQWLKENNAHYYGDVIIDTERLSRLPDDDVPTEIMSTVQQSVDEGVVDQESAGYVPLEDEASTENTDDGDQGSLSRLFSCCLLSDTFHDSLRSRCCSFAVFRHH